MAQAGGDPLDLVLASSGAPLPSAAGPCAAARKRKASAGDLIARAEQRREILRWAGLCKKLLGLQRKADDASTEMSAIAPAWNSTQRRLGDHVDSGEAKRAVRHRNRFSLHGCLKLAFTDALDAKQQSRIYVDLRASVVQCALVAQNLGKGCPKPFGCNRDGVDSCTADGWPGLHHHDQRNEQQPGADHASAGDPPDHFAADAEADAGPDAGAGHRSDCAAGFQNCKAGWSWEKKDWC